MNPPMAFDVPESQSIRNAPSPTGHSSYAHARVRKRGFITAIDLTLAALSYVLSIHLLQDQLGLKWSTEILRKTVVYVLLLRLAGLVSVRLFNSSLRYPSSADLLRVVRAIAISSLTAFVGLRLEYPELRLPRSLFVLDAALLLYLWGGFHCGARLIAYCRAQVGNEKKRVIVVGAGDAGMSLVKDLSSNPESPCRPVAVLDDDRSGHGRTVYGVPIVGEIKDLERVARQSRAEEVLICIPSATRSQMGRILAACRQANVPVRTLPSLSELIEGRVSERGLRRLNIADLLDREEVHHDPNEIRRIVGGKSVLITGAGGSIGSELAQQVASGSPAKLLLLDKSENSLFYVHRELRERYPDVPLKPLLIDVTCRDFVDDFMLQETPEIIFHAAAHKHVGLLELHPHEGIRNNVFGIRNVALAAMRCGTSLFVNISSDKAVNPCNFMGCSKRITELLMQDLARENLTRFMNVRFGNVAGSTGSVLRLFWDQIQKGGPLLVTDPRATRYFMSIPEAVYLILQAARYGRGGETFVFEMGDPINIYELAKSMSLLAGLMPGKEVPIHFIGLQKGEKFAEELWEEWEKPVPTPQNGIQVISQRDPASTAMLEKIREMETYLAMNDRVGLSVYLGRLLPQFAKNRRELLVHEEPAERAAVAMAGGNGWTS
jgi:FlaA1/EpsC-like NDP-sugar epimerase